MCLSGRCGSALTFVGYINWTQSCQTQTDAAQDALMDSTCNSSFPGSRAATIDEIVGRSIASMPATNGATSWLIPKCPNCAGTAQSVCLSGHARRCVDPGAAFPTSLWTGNPNCYQTSRSAMCVR
jgi:hypothetical protein